MDKILNEFLFGEGALAGNLRFVLRKFGVDEFIAFVHVARCVVRSGRIARASRACMFELDEWTGLVSREAKAFPQGMIALIERDHLPGNFVESLLAAVDLTRRRALSNEPASIDFRIEMAVCKVAVAESQA